MCEREREKEGKDEKGVSKRERGEMCEQNRPRERGGREGERERELQELIQ